MREQHQREMERQRTAAKLHSATSEDEFRDLRVADLKVNISYHVVL
jgi:hypothetical protein